MFRRTVCFGGVAVTSAGDLYVVGHTIGDIDGARPGVNHGGYDMFLARFDKKGNLKWIHQFGTAGDDFGFAIALRGSTEIYVAGSSNGDVSIARFDKNGIQKWSRTFGTVGEDHAFALATRGSSEVYLAGSTSGDSLSR